MSDIKEIEIAKEITLWEFLDNNKIVVPMIQRDYAQGRKDCENVRDIFLNNIKEAVENDKKQKLDFVYGTYNDSDNDKTFYPLDGQQRLTTLWLLYFYVLLKKQELKGKNKDKLKKFTYETRDSSKEFCYNLITNFDKIDNKQGSLSKEIRNQLWFFKAWKQDPTVDAMLRMLDAIDDKFKDIVDKMYNYLFGEEDKIVFYVLELKNIESPDVLFIKMNARGKPLTDFENFKADFVGYIKKIEANKDIEQKIDGEWTDLFWNKEKPSSVDERFMTFINRLMFCFLTEKEKFNASSFEEPKEITNNNVMLYKASKLYGNESDDTKIKYKSFDIYEYILGKDSKNIEEIEKIFDRFIEFKKDPTFIKSIKCPYKTNIKIQDSDEEDNSGFSFIPNYKDGTDELIVLKQLERPVFYGVCLYLIKNESYNKDNFAKWMRIIWNICTRRELRNKSDMLSVMNVLKQLSEYSNNINEKLTDGSCTKIVNKIDVNTLKNQLNEEIEKAKEEFNNPAHKDLIKEMEDYGFFKGTIGFLLYDKDSNVDWGKFEKKAEYAKKYFDENGFKNETALEVKMRANAVCILLRKTPDKKNIEEKKIFSTSEKVWSEILTSDNYKEAVDIILSNDLSSYPIENEEFKVIKESNFSRSIKDIANFPLVNYIVENLPNHEIKKFVTGCKIVKTRCESYRIAVDGDHYKRNKIMSSLDKGKTRSDGGFKIDEAFKIEGTDYFYKDFIVDFTYKNHKFTWEATGMKYDNISLLGDDNNVLGKTKILVCVDDKDNCLDEKDILKKIDELIEKKINFSNGKI